MRIISYKKIEDFAQKHKDSKVALDDWYAKVEKATWLSFSDMKNTFGSIDSVGNKRYVFNIKGNTYRLIALILLGQKIVYIRFIGTHTEYDKIKECSKI